MTRLFYGKSQEWLEGELAKAQNDLASGTTNVGGTAGDSAFTDQQNLTPQQRIQGLMLELHYLDPVKYPRGIARGARVTKGVFRDW